MLKFRINPTDTVTIVACVAETVNALQQLQAAVDFAAQEGAKLSQNKQPGFSDIWRVTLPNDEAKMRFKLMGGAELSNAFGI